MKKGRVIVFAKPQTRRTPLLRRLAAPVTLITFGLGLTYLLVAHRFRDPGPPAVSLVSIDKPLASLISSSRQAVLQRPKSAQAWGKLGQVLQAAEFPREARQCYAHAARLEPLSPRWPYLSGVLELQDQPEAALRSLRSATALAQGQTDAPRFALARALVERGQYAEAAVQLRTLLAGNANHAAAHLEMARIYAAQNQFKEATRELQMPLTNSFTERQALLLASQIAQRNQQRDVAVQLSRRALTMARAFDWPDPFLKEVQNLRVDRGKLADQANTFLQQQKLNEAEAALGQLLQAFPEDSEGLLLLGRLRYMQKNCAEAEAAYRRHLQAQPNSLNGLIQLGLALICQQSWTNAATVLEQALALKPDFAAAHHNLGVAKSHMGDAKGAIEAFRDALRCTPGDLNTMFALAEELANAGKQNEAIEYVKRAEALAPNDIRVTRAKQQLGFR
ncbi:MAG TPA: tetratricopeptide repeat protein [Verrucomicrobiae bacterium]